MTTTAATATTKTSYRGVRIEYATSRDGFVEDTAPEEMERYCDFVRARLRESYPGASLTVYLDERERIEVSGVTDWRIENEIEDNVRQIALDVWEENAFYDDSAVAESHD